MPAMTEQPTPWLILLTQASAMLEARLAHYPALDEPSERALNADIRYIARTLMEKQTKGELLVLVNQVPALLIVDLNVATIGTIRFEQTVEGSIKKAIYLKLQGILRQQMERHYNAGVSYAA